MPGHADERTVRVPPLIHDVQVRGHGGTQHRGRAQAGPWEDRAATAVGVLQPCGDPLVDVAGLRFDEDLAAWRQQLGAAAQEPGRPAADADVAVREQHGAPPAVPGQGREDRAVQGGRASLADPVDRGPRDVHPEGHNPAFGECDGEAAGAAAHVEDRSAAALEELLVHGIGRLAPPGDLERQPAAVRGPHHQCWRLLVQRLLVQGDRPRHHAVSSKM